MERLTILDEFKKWSLEFLGAKLLRLVVFGSRARGDFDDESDLDVAIVVRDLSPELKKKILEMVAELELRYDFPMSVIVFSEEEFDLLKKRGRRIALDIEREGIPL